MMSEELTCRGKGEHERQYEQCEHHKHVEEESLAAQMACDILSLVVVGVEGDAASSALHARAASH